MTAADTDVDFDPAFVQPERDSWTPVGLGPYLRGEITRAEPTIGIIRTDGLRFLYPAKEHTCIGEMESGKSWFALGCAAAEINAGNHVVYIHFEEVDPADTVERLILLGCSIGTSWTGSTSSGQNAVATLRTSKHSSTQSPR